LGFTPDVARNIVISFPHSGTRTLQSWLDENRPELIAPNCEGVGHWHFTHHPKYIEKYFELAETEGVKRRAYIPVRNLYDIADSWQRRYSSESVGKNASDMIVGLAMMIDCIDRYPDYIEVFKIEELPVLRGVGPNPEGWDKTAMTARMKELRQWVLQTEVVEAFYRTYYTAEELWWL